MWLLPWEHDKVFLHKCKEDGKLMVPTKQLWLCLDVIILLAGSQTSEYGSVSQTNKLQGLLSTHGKCLIWAGSSLCFVVMSQAVQLFLAWCVFHRSRYRIFAFLPALRAPEQGSWPSVSSWYQEIHQPVWLLSPPNPCCAVEQCRHPVLAHQDTRQASSISAEQTTGMVTWLLGRAWSPAELCALLCPDLCLSALCSRGGSHHSWTKLDKAFSHSKEHMSLWCYHSPLAGIPKGWIPVLNTLELYLPPTLAVLTSSS